MSEIQTKLFDKLRAKVAKANSVAPDEASGPDERDETIARLEREIEAERDNAAELRRTIDEQRFRIEVLEQSYSKQLEDARLGAERAEDALDAEKARANELDTLRETLAAELDKAKKELARLTDRERASLSLDSVLSPRASRPEGMSTDNARADASVSIDDMLAEDSVVDGRDQVVKRPTLNGPSAASTTDDDDEMLEDMLSPNLVFGDKDRASD